MTSTNNPSKKINEEALYAFYTHAVLPQFGIKNRRVSWTESRRIDGDEFAHYMTIDTAPHVLIWEDYEGSGNNTDYISDLVAHGAEFEFVQPTSQTEKAPSYDGFRLPAPSQYCENVTGTFTLIRLN